MRDKSGLCARDRRTAVSEKTINVPKETYDVTDDDLALFEDLLPTIEISLQSLFDHLADKGKLDAGVLGF